MRGWVTGGQMGRMRGAQTMPAPRKYPLELRERAVRMYRTAEPKPVIRRMAEDLGVHHEALRNWIRQAEADAGERGDVLTTAEREELAALRKERRPPSRPSRRRFARWSSGWAIVARIPRLRR
ncbi:MULTISPECIES: transposase [unclassified Streptomyces]|uniref:transposase n=2 Tax=Streptomyces TaxID=1883 RepID=UPI002E15FB42|nr:MULTISPECIES: transposase [unclassified Streptomyces]